MPAIWVARNSFTGASIIKIPFTLNMNRRSFLVAGTAAAVTTLIRIPKARASADAFLKQTITIDTHAHPGAFWRKNGNVSLALDEIKDSHITAFTFSVPVDHPILDRTYGGRIFAKRAPGSGELYKFAKAGIELGISEMSDKGIPVARSAADIVAAKKSATPTGVLALEGGGFAEDRLEAIKEMYELGVRIIQPVHYNTASPFGDIQGQDEKGGLTSDGKTFVKELGRLGIILDVAHMTEEGVAKAADAYGGPLLVSHVLYRPPRMGLNRFKRWASSEYAKRVVDTGGLLGVWNITGYRFPEYFGYDSGKEMTISTFRELADEYGVDHVCLGSDVGSTEGWFNGYDDLPKLVEALRDAGFNDNEIAKMLGGNVLKLFEGVTS